MFYFIELKGDGFKVIESKNESGYPDALAESAGRVYPARFEPIPTVQADEVYVSGTSFSLDGEVANIHGTLRKKTANELAEETKQQLVSIVQNHMDAAAQALGYDDIKTAVTYAEEPSVPKFQVEGLAFRTWRSLVWAKCYEILEAVLTGGRQVPTATDLLAELPVLTLGGE